MRASGLPWCLLAGALLLPASAPARPRVPPVFPGVRAVLWIGAHPDDEVIAAPLLARLCRDEQLACTFLVFTRGERGDCRLPLGCKPDLATVRSAEMRRAARVFGAHLTQWSHADGGGAPGGSATVWDDEAGGHGALVHALAKFVAAVDPDLVLTFDPRHGSTCHPDHRALGELVVEALGTATSKPLLYLLESRVSMAESPLRFSIASAAPATAGAIGFDASLSGSGLAPGWQALLDDAARHPSQFDPPRLAALRAVPTGQQVVFAGPASTLLVSPSVAACE